MKSSPSKDHESRRQQALQVFLSHFFFNLIGLIVFSILRLPKSLAMSLAEKVAVYQWFGVVYIVGCFLLIPVSGIFFALASETLYRVVMYTITCFLLSAWIITKLQEMFDITFLNNQPCSPLTSYIFLYQVM